MNAYREICGILSAMGANPQITENGVKINAPTVSEKTYLVGINSGSTAAHIGYYADTPDRNYRIYYCGSDTGERFEYIGYAANYLRKLAEQWEGLGFRVTYTYGTRDDVPHRGTNA